MSRTYEVLVAIQRGQSVKTALIESPLEYAPEDYFAGKHESIENKGTVTIIGDAADWLPDALMEEK